MRGARHTVALVAIVVMTLWVGAPAYASVSPQPETSTASVPSPPSADTPTLEPARSSVARPMAAQTTPASVVSGISAPTILIGLGVAWLLFIGLGMLRRR